MHCKSRIHAFLHFYVTLCTYTCYICFHISVWRPFRQLMEAKSRRYYDPESIAKLRIMKCITGWWFQPIWKILVSWDDSSQYMGNKQIRYISSRATWKSRVSSVPMCNPFAFSTLQVAGLDVSPILRQTHYSYNCWSNKLETIVPQHFRFLHETLLYQFPISFLRKSPIPSGNRTWQWKASHLCMIFQVDCSSLCDILNTPQKPCFRDKVRTLGSIELGVSQKWFLFLLFPSRNLDSVQGFPPYSNGTGFSHGFPWFCGGVSQPNRDPGTGLGTCAVLITTGTPWRWWQWSKNGEKIGSPSLKQISRLKYQ